MIKQWVCPVDKEPEIGTVDPTHQQKRLATVLVFSRTKHGANRLAKALKMRALKPAAIHRNKSQTARTKSFGRL